jgi:hypothetical protein
MNRSISGGGPIVVLNYGTTGRACMLDYRFFPILASILCLSIQSIPAVRAQQAGAKPSYQQVKGITEESLLRINPSTGKTYLSEWSERSIISESAKRKGPNFRFDLRICQDAGYWFGIDYKTNYDLYGVSTLLTQIKMYEYFFEKLGIPPAVWAASLSR